MKLKELLLKDFNIDLPISGSFGQSKDSPIVILTDNQEEASLTQYQILKCIYSVSEFTWRQTERSYIDSSAGLIEKVSSDVKYINKDDESQIITEKRNFYFDLSLLNIDITKKLSPPLISLPQPYNTKISQQLTWLHFDRMFNNENICNGAGFTLFYSLPFTKCSIYIYNNNAQKEIETNPDHATKTEFTNICKSIESSNNIIDILSEHKMNNSYWKVYKTNTGYTLAIIAPYKNHFIKSRTTISTEEGFIWDCTINSLKSLFGRI